MRPLFHFVCLALLAGSLSACDRTQPIYNVEANPVPMVAHHRVSAEQVGNLIKKTALDAGWVIEKAQPGLLHCSLKFREHTAVVDISYTDKNYSIRHASSENLLEEGGKIHRKYNERVHQLQNEIDKSLSKFLNG